MNEQVKVNGILRVCCSQSANLRVVTNDREGGLLVRVCKVCERKHYSMRAEPGRLHLRRSNG